MLWSDNGKWVDEYAVYVTGNLFFARRSTDEHAVQVIADIGRASDVRPNVVALDAIPRGHLLFVKNEDQPGVIGEMGSVLGRRDINIARMTVGRKPGSRRAVMILEVDSEVPAVALPELMKVSGVREVKAIALD